MRTHVVQKLTDEVGPHGGKCHDHGSHGRSQLGVNIGQPFGARRRCRPGFRARGILACCDLRELRRPTDVGDAMPVAVDEHRRLHRARQVLDVLQRLQYPEAGADARVVDDPVELRPIGRRLDHVVRIPEIRQVVWTARLRPIRGQAFVDADVEKSRMSLELILVGRNDLVGRVRDDFIVEAPTRERRAGRAARRERDVVALPRIRLHVVDLPLGVIAEEWICGVAGPGIDLPMRKRACRSGELVDEVSALPRLPSGENLAGEAFRNGYRGSWCATTRWREQRDVRVADDRNTRLRL